MGLFDFLRPKPRSALEVLQSSPWVQRQKELFDAMDAMCEDGVDADEMPNGTDEFGLTATNPIPCRTVLGSTAYLGRLRAADGVKVAYERLGSAQSPVSPYPLDIYEAKHPTGRKLASLYISPYQKRISRKAPRGFALAENSFADAALAKDIVTEPDGTAKYYSCGVLHREDGPAVIEVYPDYDGPERHRSWYRLGVQDREDGPAVIGGRTTNGQYEWRRAGVLHREEGPAVIELIESFEFGRGPVYEWWLDGIRHKAQDGNGVVYYFREGQIVLTELPDGNRIVERDSNFRFEDADGNDLGDPPPLEAYGGYLEDSECLSPLYREPESTFETFNPTAEGAED